MRPRRILIIENSTIHCRALSRIFLKQNSTTLTATRAEEGLILAALNDPDLIVLDLLLPDMDGFEVCERLKRNTQTQHIPVVLFSGRTRIVDIMRGFEAGADMFISKGLGYEKLVNYINATLSGRNGDGGRVDDQLVMTTCGELLKSLFAAFDGMVRPRLEITLGAGTASTVLQQAAEKLPAGWKIQTLREGTHDYLAVRGAVVEFNTFVSEVFRILDEMTDRIEASHLKGAFEQQVALLN